ncbi:MAG: PQQ-dependent sugar dehydrogenase [Phycisphaerales bacterium]|nr:PQQ-dependent sugar dehydrogenase [Phycisphaerales bacterium]
MILAIALGLLLVAEESTYYTVETIPAPEGEIIEVGGMDMLPDGSLALSTRRGRVWIVENPDAEDPADARWHLFADGLAEGLGLKVVDGEIYVIQRSELSRLRDDDGDRRVDHIDTLTQGWGLTNNYHEYAFGLPVDDEGNFYVSLNLAFINPAWWHGQSQEPWRGWVLRISPEGEVTPMAHGFRSPCGIGMNIEGDVFVTDNQGDWMPVCPIFHVKDGGFYGHPNSLRWTEDWRSTGEIPSDTQPVLEERQPAAIWIPYDWSRSTGNLVPDTTDGRFGPFDEQLFVAELTNGMVLRTDLEKVNGEYQGAIWPFRKRVGSVCRVRFGDDGTLYTGLTNRGWGGMEPAHGLRRVRWTGVMPMEMSSVDLLEDGFEIEFTRPVAEEVEVSADDINARTYRYNWWWEYGSPEQASEPLAVSDVSLSDDRRTLIVRTPDLVAGKCVRMKLSDIRGDEGHELLHPEFSYTVNQMPGDTSPAPMIAQRVAPPLERGAGILDGWVRLTWGDPTDRVNGRGWELASAELDADGAFTRKPGNHLLMNSPEDANDLVLPMQDLDGRLQFSLFLSSGGGVGVGLPSGARVVLRDHGTIPPAATIQVIEADDRVLGEWPVEFWFGPGQWQRLALDYEGPQFDPQGRQLNRGRIGGIYLDNVAIVDPFDLPMTTGDGERGSMRLLGDVGPGGVSNIRFYATDRGLPPGGEDYLSPTAMEAVVRVGDVEDRREDNRQILSGDGVMTWPDPLPDSYVVAALVRYKTGTSSSLDLGDGLAVHLGHDEVGSPATGSIAGVDEVTTQLIAAGSWFTMEAAVESSKDGRTISVTLNGVELSGGRLPWSAGEAGSDLSLSIRMSAGELEIRRLSVIPMP